MANDTYSKNYLVIHGPLDKAQRDYRDAPGYSDSECVGFGNTSHNGDPAICMKLTVSDFKRTANNKLKCTIYTAELRELRPTTLGIGFGYPFTVSACFVVAKKETDQSKIQALYNKSKHHGATTLFTKEVYEWPSANRYLWPDAGADGKAKLKEKKTFTMPTPGQGEAVYLFISNLSDCPCDQGGDDVVVFYEELTAYFPSDPDPYIWRFQQGKDPNHTDSEAALAWHLVRPFYVCVEVEENGVTRKGWASCEDITKIV